jgi:ABC-2 type transport system permease protein
MASFWNFFSFELRFRAKSLSTYVYFTIWLVFSFLNVASESFGPLANSNGKVLLNSAYANTYNDIGTSLFGIVIIAAIFGTSILRDFSAIRTKFSSQSLSRNSRTSAAAGLVHL